MFIQTCLVQQPSLGIDYEQSAVNLINLENADVLQHHSSQKKYIIDLEGIAVMEIYWLAVITILVKYFVVLTTWKSGLS